MNARAAWGVFLVTVPTVIALCFLYLDFGWRGPFALVLPLMLVTGVVILVMEFAKERLG